MNIQLYLFLGMALTTISCVLYLGITERDRLLGRAWRRSVGTDTAYRILTDTNVETELLLAAGMETLDVLERRKPIEPRDFQVTERDGRPIEFRSLPEDAA